MRELGIDIETYSSEDLTSCGVYRYAEAEDFTVLLFAYSVDNGEVDCIDLAGGERLPDDIREALTDPAVVKTAYNAAFERVCLSRWLGLPEGEYLDPSQWKCTMIRAARLGLPLSLASCGDALGITEGKMKEGAALIRYFSMPGRDGRRHLPADAPDKWEVFKSYCKRDVGVEQAILARVRALPVPAFDERLYIADQEINDRGVLIDRRLVENAVRFDDEYKAELLQEAREISGLGNPNSPAQLKQWISDTTKFPVTTLNRNSLDELEANLRYYPKVQRLLALRRLLELTIIGSEI